MSLVKDLVHPKINIQSLITHPHVEPFSSFWWKTL